MEAAMPRASWKGFLRLSLVSCPIYLTPATTKTKTIRLNRIWVPSEEPATIEREPVVQRPSQVRPSLPVNTSVEDEPEPAETYAAPATRVALRPHDPHSGEEIERDEVVKGYEFERLTSDADPEAIAIAQLIIKRRSGAFDPSTFRDRYQEALRQLVEAKMKGRRIVPPVPRKVAPAPDLMAALKQSLAEIDDGK